MEQKVYWHHADAEKGEVALDVDGSSYRNPPRRAGYGGDIRDHRGEWKMGFSGHVDYINCLRVELLAILNGLSVAWELKDRPRNVICRSNCLQAGTNEESLNGDEEIPESVLKSIDGMEANQNIAVTKGQKFKIKRGNGGGGAKNMAHNNERSSKDLKLTTRGGGSFKGRTGVKKGVEDVVGRMGDELIGSLVAHSKKTRSEIGGNNMGDDLGSVDKGNEGPKTVTHPNRPQPPDLTDTPPFVPSSISTQQNEDMTLEGEAGSEEYWCSVLRGKYNSDYLQDGGIATGGSKLKKKKLRGSLWIESVFRSSEIKLSYRTKITCLTMKISDLSLMASITGTSMSLLSNQSMVCAIKAHGFGENRKSGLQDLDVLTGGQLITEDLGHNLEKVLFVSAN
ncbi:hypothetical protein P8452_12257 [Trifolium repens]|nr:hypothetical protein P8452_12257 [Trifolium repens]